MEQMLAVNGRRSLLRQAGDSAVRVEETRAEHTLRQIEARLRTVFYQLAYAQNRKKALVESVSELRDLVHILREREKAGEGARFDMLRAEREIVERELESAEADTMIAAAQARLAGFLDGSVDPGTLVVNASPPTRLCASRSLGGPLGWPLGPERLPSRDGATGAMAS